MISDPRILKEAFAVHRMWDVTLSSAVRTGTTGGINIATVSSDKNCSFGKFIHKLGECCGNVDEQLYRNILDSHREFHISIGEVLRMVSMGQTKEAAGMLRTGGAYYITSRTLLKSIEAISHSPRRTQASLSGRCSPSQPPIRRQDDQSHRHG